MIEIFEKSSIKTLVENAVKAKYGLFNPLEVIEDGRKVRFVNIEDDKVISEYESSTKLVGFKNISNAISEYIEENFIPPRIYEIGESIIGTSQTIEGGQIIINENGINVLVAMRNITAKEKRTFKQELIKVHVDVLEDKLPILSFRAGNIFSFDTAIMLEAVYGKRVISGDFNKAVDSLKVKRSTLQEHLKSRKITFYFTDSARNEIVAIRRGYFPKESIKKVLLAINQQDEYEILKKKVFKYQATTNTNSVLKYAGKYI